MRRSIKSLTCHPTFPRFASSLSEPNLKVLSRKVKEDDPFVYSHSEDKYPAKNNLAIQKKSPSLKGNEQKDSDDKASAASGKIRLSSTKRGKIASNKKSIPALNFEVSKQVHLAMGGTALDPAPAPFQLSNWGEDSLYTLVLLRHGESEWNRENRYTGWCDVNLTERGKQEARDAGRLLYENGIEIDHAFTSLLRRASFSTNMALNTARQHWVPITKTWRLNERHYGALQGYNKDTAYKELNIDQELVMQMRRSYGTRPPIMLDDHQHWHGNDRRYRKLTKSQLDASRGESLKDAAERIMPFFNSMIVPSLQAGNRCLVVSHANTIRTLIKHIDNIGDEEIKALSIPTGIPLLYRLDKNMVPVDPKVELEVKYLVQPKGFKWATSHACGFHGVYLGDVERLHDIQSKRDITNRDWQRIILRNIFKAVEEEDKELFEEDGVIEARRLWWKVHEKTQEQDFSNMLLLNKFNEHLEMIMNVRKQRYLTPSGFMKIVDKLHLDAEGQVVEPFEKLCSDDYEREKKERRDELFAIDDEEMCLIR